MKKSTIRKTLIISLFGAALLTTFLGFRYMGAPVVLSEKINDCPYVFYEKNKTVVKWIEDGELVQKTYHNADFKELKIASCEDFEAKYLRVDSLIVTDNNQSYLGVSKIAMLSDIHGQHDLFVQLLQAHEIIDDQRNWNYGNGHFVIVGDVFDRGDKVTESLWLLYKLEQQAIEAGGRVHLLLGNHEIMVLKGDLRYISEKYQKVSIKMNLPYDELYNTNTAIGQWLRTKPIAVSINDIAFAHAGFSPEFAEGNYDIVSVNRIFQQNIIDNAKDSIMNDATLKFMVKSDGPIWYRGYFKDDDFTKQEAQKILDYMGMKHIVVGHTSMDQVMLHYDGLIYSVDSSIKKGEKGEILFWEDGIFYRGQLDGSKSLFD